MKICITGISEQDEFRPAVRCWMLRTPDEHRLYPLIYEPGDVDLIGHFLSRETALTEHLHRVAEFAEDDRWPWVPRTMDDAVVFAPVAAIQLPVPCQQVWCVDCDQDIHLQPDNPVICDCGQPYTVGGQDVRP
jgi:hypothetical protein